MTYIPRITPCRDDSEGFEDQERYEELGLPSEWINIVNSRLRRGLRWIAPDEYFWTPDGFFTVIEGVTPSMLKQIRAKTGGSFYELSLEDQCKLLEVRYERITAASLAAGGVPLDNVGHRGGMAIEEFAFQSLGAQGWRGSWREGSGISYIVFLVQRLVNGKGIRFYPNVYDTSQFNTSGVVAPPFVREVLSDKETHILWTAIREVTDGLLEDLYKELPSLDRTGLLSLAQLLDIWHIFGQEGIYRICARAMLGFYSYGGWPDLTLHRDGKIRFVEVKKGSDKLNRNQSYWVRNFALPLDWDVVVLNVVVPK